MKAAPDISQADGAIGSGSICTLPNTNDWYLTTDQGITLGPYASREETLTVLVLLGLRETPAPAGKDWRDN